MLFDLTDKSTPQPLLVRLRSTKGVAKTLNVGLSQKCEDWLRYEIRDSGHTTGVCTGLREDKAADGWSVVGLGPEPKPAPPPPKSAEKPAPAAEPKPAPPEKKK